MIEAIPTLSLDGYITDKSRIMIALYEYFIASMHSQSVTYSNKITSLKYILSVSEDAEQAAIKINNELSVMYDRYFKTVSVDTNIIEGVNTRTVEVDITCVDYLDEVHTLSRTTRVTDNNITRFETLQEVYNG